MGGRPLAAPTRNAFRSMAANTSNFFLTNAQAAFSTSIGVGARIARPHNERASGKIKNSFDPIIHRDEEVIRGTTLINAGGVLSASTFVQNF